MARLSPEELNRLKQAGATQKQINDVLRNRISLKDQLAELEKDNRDTTLDILSIQRDINDELRRSLGASVRRTTEAKQLLKLGNDISSQLNKQVKEYDSVSNVLKDISKNEELSNKAKKEAKRLAGDSFGKISQIAQAQQNLVNLNEQLLTADQDKVGNIQKQIAENESLLSKELQNLSIREEAALALQLSADNLDAQNKNLRDQIPEIEKINKNFGITGNIIGGFQKLARKFGLDGLSDRLDLLKTDLKDMAKDGASSGQIMTEGFKGLKGAVKDFFKDPVAQLGLALKILGFFKKLLMDGADITGKLRKETGLQFSNAQKVRASINAQVDASNNLFINSKRLTESFGKLTEQTGLMGDFGGRTLETFTALNQQLGISEQGATKLALLARIQGKNTEAVLEKSVAVVNSINRQTGEAVNAKGVLRDMANVSDTLVVRLGMAPEAIAGAVTEATRLGLKLDELAASNRQMLNLQQSIEDEMTAELFLGTSLNLERARGLALVGDYQNLAKEIMNQEAILSGFRNGNVLQQEKAAKALGMQTDQLAKIVLQEEYRTLSASRFKSIYGEQSYEQMKQLEATEKFQEAIIRLQGAMTDLLTPILPIVEAFGSIVGFLMKSKIFAGALQGLLAGIAIRSIASAISSIFTSFGKIPYGIGIPLAFAAVGGMMGLISSASGKVKLAEGGIVKPSPGGTEAIIGEGGEAEMVLPLSKAEQAGFGNKNTSDKPMLDVSRLIEAGKQTNALLLDLVKKPLSVYLDSEKIDQNLALNVKK